MMTNGEPPLWRIGDPDRDQEQFDAARWVLDHTDPPTFVVGVSDDATWPRFQPGPLHGNAGFRSTTVQVRFDLDAPADAVLVLDVYAGHGPTPALDVELNDEVGRFHPRPVRTDRSAVNGPPTLVAGWARVEVPVPAGRQRAGANDLRVTTVQAEEVDPTELTPPTAAHFNWFGSGIAWGGLSWWAATLDADAAVTVDPTPLYVTDEDGTLRELVDVTVRHEGALDRRVTLTVDAATVQAVLPADGRSFGEWRARLAVPAPASATAAAVRVHAGDALLHDGRTTLTPCRRWTVHVLPHVHLDIGYTDHAAKVMELHSRNLDRAVDILRTTEDWAFTVDGTMIVDDHLRTRTDAAVDDVVAALRGGRLGLNAFSMLFLTGVASREEVYRAAYAARRLGEDHGVPVDVAHLTDVPSYSSAIPSLLRDLGIERFVGIQNHGRAATIDSDDLHLRSPFRWVGPDGAEVVTFFADAYAQLRFLFGDPVTTAGGANILPRLLARHDHEGYLPSDIPIVGSHSDNEDVADGYAAVVARWNDRYTWPRLRFSTFTEYFDAVEPLRDRLPVVTGDGGSYWEDGVGAHAASMVRYRDAQDTLPVVETLTTLLADAGDTLRVDRAGLDATWDAVLLGCEHTWSSAHSVKRHHSHDTADMTDWKVHQIEHAARLVTDAGRRAMSQLGELVTTEGASVLAFNGLAWERELEVELELDPGEALLDADGAAVPLDVVGTRDDLQVVRARASVPALGYHAWRLGVTAAPREPAVAPLADDGRLTVGGWEVAVVDGRITSLRRDGRELVDASRHGLAEVLHVVARGTEAGRGLDDSRTTLHDVGPKLPAPDLDVRAATLGTPTVRTTPWGAVLRLTGAGRTLPHVAVELHLRRDDDRCDVVVELDKQAELAKESVYVAFPFAVADPTVRYDRQVGWVDPTVDHQPGACNEWFTTLHGVRVGDVAWCSVDAPLLALGEPVAGRWPRTTTPSATLLSWPMNNHWFTNYPASQSGTLRLRYAFRPGVTTDGDAARFGREVRGGALTSRMAFQDKTDTGPRPLPAHRGRLTTLPAAWAGLDVQVMAAGDGRGHVLRVADLDGVGRRVPLDGLDGLRVTHRCDALERDVATVAPGELLDLDAWDVVTLRAVAP